MPATPEIFTLQFPVQPADIDELGHVNNVTYVRWIQEIAVADWQHGASQDDQAQINWIVLRHEIDYKQSAKLGDEIKARTWVGAARGIRFERHTEILRATDDTLLAVARTVWCPVNAQTGRPTAVSSEVRARFSL